MVLAENIAKSTKHLGIYEARIIEVLADYFTLSGYDVVPHSSLNIAWGSVLSDVDLLLVKDQLLTYVEVKSSRDNLSRAFGQIERVKDYVDYAYVATDRNIKKWESENIGLILVQENEVKLAKKGRRFRNKPCFYSVATLKKKCLARFFGANDRDLNCENKYQLAEYVYANRECDRLLLKEIVTCGDLCSSNCPLASASSRAIIPLTG